MILKNILTILKKSITNISAVSIISAAMVNGSCATVSLNTLQVLTMSTSTGPRLTLGCQTSDKQIEYYTYSGRHVVQMQEVMACATLRIDDLVSHSWHRRRLLTRLQFLETQDLGSYQSPGRMLKRCLQTKLSQYHQIIRSSSNQHKTGWNVQRRSYHTRYRQEGSRVNPSRKPMRRTTKKVLTPRSTGRTRVTTRMTEKN